MEKYSGFRNKEVVNVSDGARLGYVCDLEIDLEKGRICTLLLPGTKRGFRGGKCGEIRVPFDCICRVGEDIILVNLPHLPFPDKNCK